MSNALTTYRPGLMGRTVFDDFFDNFFMDLPQHLKRTTSGYPVADIYTLQDGSTAMEFALAGFSKDDLMIDVKPEKRSITISASSSTEAEDNRRIARRSFTKTYVNYDDNLDVAKTTAKFENGLLTVTVPTRPEIEPVKIETKRILINCM